jgi:putative ABC transport system permease protein
MPGLALAWAATVALRPSISNFLPGFALNRAIAVEAVILMLALGVVTGFIPGLNAFRLRIAAALGRG